MIVSLLSPLLFACVVAILGLLVGSFLNVIIYRIPLQLQQQWRHECETLLKLPISPITAINIVYPASHCPHCKQPLRYYDNIPLLSFLWLKGKCRYCHHAIAWRYPLIELCSALLAAYLAYTIGLHWQLIPMLVLSWGLLCLSCIDIDHRLLPDSITLPLLWLGLLINSGYGWVSPSSAIFGASIGYSSLWLMTQLFYVLTKKQGMGNGDFKLFALFGAWLGWRTLPFILLLASFLGTVIGLYLILIKKYPRDYPIPFGPFLCLAGWINLMWGNQLMGVL